jgi:protein-tyrosine phosphatase
MSNAPPVKVLFVCMGNICRSPTAEGVFRKLVLEEGLVERVHIDSAGTHAYHIGDRPDRRAQMAAERRGVSLEGIRARRVSDADFDAFHYILAMDEDNLLYLQSAATENSLARLSLFLDFADSAVREIPDPYYGGAAGFERVLDLVEDASRGLLQAIRREL